MKKVSTGECCHVVQMVGCVSTALPLALVLEFVPFGDLLSYLKYWRQKVRFNSFHHCGAFVSLYIPQGCYFDLIDNFFDCIYYGIIFEKVERVVSQTSMCALSGCNEQYHDNRYQLMLRCWHSELSVLQIGS